MPTDAWLLRVARSQRAEPLQLMPSAVIDRVYERMSTATLNLLDSILGFLGSARNWQGHADKAFVRKV